MSIALVIRNINPDRRDTAMLVVTTLTEQQAEQWPAQFQQAEAVSLAPCSPAQSAGQLYYFPQKPNKLTPAPLRYQPNDHCAPQDMAYLWCSTLDQAG